MTITIWLVRHGETDSNSTGVFQGQLDVPLNARGQEQAAAAGAALAEVDFTRAYSSDLLRAARTAQIIVGERTPIVLEPGLRERNWGILQGVAYATAGETLEPHGLRQAWERGEFFDRDVAPPEGESYRRLYNRSKRFVRALDEELGDVADAQVLVVGHGGQLGVLLTSLLNLPLARRNHFRFANCGITKLTRKSGRTTLDILNYVPWGDPLRLQRDAQAETRRLSDELNLPRL